MVPSLRGKSYWLEFKGALTDKTWTPLPAVVGDGSAMILTDPTATDPQRFYRLREE